MIRNLFEAHWNTGTCVIIILGVVVIILFGIGKIIEANKYDDRKNDPT